MCLGIFFSQNPISRILLYTKSKSSKLFDGACHYEVTEAKHWWCWYFILFGIICLEENNFPVPHFFLSKHEWYFFIEKKKLILLYKVRKWWKLVTFWETSLALPEICSPHFVNSDTGAIAGFLFRFIACYIHKHFEPGMTQY